MTSSYAPLSFAAWRALSPEQQAARLRSAGQNDPAWIVPPDGFPSRPTTPGPLEGLVFAVKDNIDVAGVSTTAGCPDFAYTPAHDSAAVELLVEAGARPVGKTNLDQFATGLVGTRSPYGVVPNVHRPDVIGGGSSSGSASVVARGLVPFALGTDTAGSGRVPAGLQGIVGLKPTRGWFSARGVVPACQSLDCVSIFTARVDDAVTVASVLGRFDPKDPYARPAPMTAAFRPLTRRLAIPAALEWGGDAVQALAWEEALGRWRALGYQLIPVDPAPLAEMAALLYSGPWVAERVAALTGFYPARAEAIHPVVRGILEGASRFDAASAFRAEVRRRELAAVIADLWPDCDALLVPTVPRVYTIEEVLADPLGTNAHLGTWTNFVNLADLCALAVPGGTRSDGLPFGVTLVGRAWEDGRLALVGREWESWSDEVQVAVVGAHLSGLPLNPLLTRRGARLVGSSRTAPLYRLYALEDQVPPKPGLVRTTSGGGSVAVEVWSLPRAAYGAFVAEIPSPLGIGTLELEDGRRVQGFLCEAWTLEGRRDITEWGGWKAWLASRP
ncbi:MAG TPA: allophanate hydrolase [Spirochaetia bacterium]|nr:allophanate hydrolase [Spirochaetia bacterium]